MLGDIVAAVRLTADADDIRTLYGEMPEAFDTAALKALCGDAPQVRKGGGLLAVVVPVRQLNDAAVCWIGWLVAKVPPVTELSAAIELLRSASVSLERAQGSQPAARTEVSDIPAFMAAKRAAGAEFTNKATIRHIQRFLLRANRGIFELDREFDQQRVMRRQSGARRAARHLNRAQNAQRAQRSIRAMHTARQDFTHEDRRAAVENGNFRTVNFDRGIVNATADQRGHDMFNG